MSAPDTNVEKQTRRHRPSLGGIAFAVAVAAILLAGYIFMIASGGSDEAEDAPAPAAATEATPTE